ncbi:MAG: alpha/beta fold hydrolase [Anaeromyxobacteraceae bacterium]
MPDLFPGFATHDVQTSGARIHARVGGSGPPLLLLHGYPQTHAIWHRVARRLAERFTVVVADLRGYGDSEKPASAADHAPYAKRAMAQDQVEVMAALGFAAFHLVGHDRGGRVAHRLALDHPARVTTLTVLDIAPTRHMYERGGFEFARAYYHWYFLVQPEPLPERLIGADPEFFLREKLGRGRVGLAPFAPGALAEYVRCFTAPAAIHASCEDYRAAAGLDLEHDRTDEAARIEAPLLALWGAHGVVHRCFDVLAAWRERARSVAGRPLACGHYIAEEAPDALMAELLPHLERGTEP